MKKYKNIPLKLKYLNSSIEKHIKFNFFNKNKLLFGKNYMSLLKPYISFKITLKYTIWNVLC